MGRQAWKKGVFLTVSLFSAAFFCRLERISRTVYLGERQEATEEEAGSGQEADLSERSTETARQTETEQHTEKAAEAEKQAGRIRVLIRSDDFAELYHQEVRILCKKEAVLCEKGREEPLDEEEELRFSAASSLKEGESVLLKGREEDGCFALMGLKRGYEDPLFEGTLTISRRKEGFLVINELPLELYIRKVIPSEMPSSYPLEALKAQAVCARTYAVKQMEVLRMEDGIPADVDDSVSYQVYNNQSESERSRQAAEETRGQIMTENGELVDALYYSTSCGIRMDQDLSLEPVFASFLSVKHESDYEKDEPWYRWNVYFPVEQLTERAAEKGYGEIGSVTELIPEKRESSGCLSVLTIRGSTGNAKIEGEYAIRKFLNPQDLRVNLKNGEAAPELGMLPSAFFYLVPSYEGESLLGYEIIGGGYGHGRGLSQNGARKMAEKGKNFLEILKYYYGEIELHDTLDTGDQSFIKKNQ